jgi:hypothetical protein
VLICVSRAYDELLSAQCNSDIQKSTTGSGNGVRRHLQGGFYAERQSGGELHVEAWAWAGVCPPPVPPWPTRLWGASSFAAPGHAMVCKSVASCVARDSCAMILWLLPCVVTSAAPLVHPAWSPTTCNPAVCTALR